MRDWVKGDTQREVENEWRWEEGERCDRDTIIVCIIT